MAANPIDYVSRSLSGKHVVLLHEDLRYAQLIEFSYLLNGLEQERACIYLTYREKSLAREQMKKRGLDVASFEKKDQLHIARIHGQAFDFWNAVEQLAHRTNEPHSFRRCRIVWPFDKKRYDEDQLSVHIEEDSKVQNVLEERSLCSTSDAGKIFRDFNGSILCSYPIDHRSLDHPHTIRHHLNNHDGVILAPKHGRGAVLQSNGLNKSDMEDWIKNKLKI